MLNKKILESFSNPDSSNLNDNRFDSKEDSEEFHGQFYNKLVALNEKIELYKEAFYNKSPRFLKETEYERMRIFLNKLQRNKERKAW